VIVLKDHKSPGVPVFTNFCVANVEETKPQEPNLSLEPEP
jgi:hypothetical protein